MECKHTPFPYKRILASDVHGWFSSSIDLIATAIERICTLHTVTQNKVPIIPIDHYSSYTNLKRVTAWILRFVNNCRTNKNEASTSDARSITY